MNTWQEFRRLSDLPSAQMLVNLLLAEQVPARIEGSQILPGTEGGFVVKVPAELLHRARWLAPEAEFDEAELVFLATGKFDDSQPP